LASFYLDSDVSMRLAPLLRAAGHDVTTAEDQGRRRATDDEQLLIAAQQRRILLTHNRKDFVLLHDAWRRWPAAFAISLPPHPGILVLDQRLEPELATPVTDLLARTPPALLANTLLWWRFPGEWHQQTTDRRWVPYLR
jgi:hypothetical protein